MRLIQYAFIFIVTLSLIGLSIYGFAWVFERAAETRLDTLGAASNVSNLGALADYLNYSWGLGIALTTAVLGGLVTLIVGIAATRQGETDNLRFVEEKIGDVFAFVIVLVETLQAFVTGGNLAKRDVRSFLNRDDAGELVPEFFGGSTQSQAVQRFRATLDTYAEEMNNVSNRLQLSLFNSRDDLFIPQVLNHQVQSVLGKQDPLRRLSDTLPERLQIGEDLLTSDRFELFENIQYFAAQTKPEHFVSAYLRMPTAFLTVDYVGHVLYNQYSPAHSQSVQAIGGHRVTGASINFGAAYLTHVFAVIPNAQSILMPFQKLFGGRSQLVQRLLRQVDVDATSLASRFWLESMELSLKQPDRLLILHLESGESLFWGDCKADVDLEQVFFPHETSGSSLDYQQRARSIWEHGMFEAEATEAYQRLWVDAALAHRRQGGSGVPGGTARRQAPTSPLARLTRR